MILSKSVECYTEANLEQRCLEVLGVHSGHLGFMQITRVPPKLPLWQPS